MQLPLIQSLREDRTLQALWLARWLHRPPRPAELIEVQMLSVGSLWQVEAGIGGLFWTQVLRLC